MLIGAKHLPMSPRTFDDAAGIVATRIGLAGSDP
jgi:hypothetical protein